MSPSHLQRETLRGNRRFYSTARVLRCAREVLRRRDKYAWDRMLESGWLWFYSRMWHKDPGNRAHERMLRALRPKGPFTGPLAHSIEHDEFEVPAEEGVSAEVAAPEVAAESSAGRETLPV